MGQNAQFGRANRALISIDGVLLAVALLIFMFCAAAFIRITNATSDPSSNRGLINLAAEDSLLAFEDFNFGAAAWIPDAPSARLPGVGPVLGPFTDESVERAFQLPVGTSRLRIGFDLHLHSTWAEGDVLNISIGQQNVLGISVTALDAEGTTLELAVENGEMIDVDVQQSSITPRVAEPALPGATEDAIVRLHVMLGFSPQSDSLTLGIAAAPSDGASWSLDNLAIVATTDGGA